MFNKKLKERVRRIEYQLSYISNIVDKIEKLEKFKRDCEARDKSTELLRKHNVA